MFESALCTILLCKDHWCLHLPVLQPSPVNPGEQVQVTPSSLVKPWQVALFSHEGEHSRTSEKAKQHSSKFMWTAVIKLEAPYIPRIPKGESFFIEYLEAVYFWHTSNIYCTCNGPPSFLMLQPFCLVDLQSAVRMKASFLPTVGFGYYWVLLFEEFGYGFLSVLAPGGALYFLSPLDIFQSPIGITMVSCFLWKSISIPTMIQGAGNMRNSLQMKAIPYSPLILHIRTSASLSNRCQITGTRHTVSWHTIE